MNSPSTSFAVTCRALAIDQGQLLIAQQGQSHPFYCLPGGKLEVGETLEACLARELKEETGISAEIGKLLIINEWVSERDHRIEFFYWIKNAAEFRTADLTTASHGQELSDLRFADPTTPDLDLRPSYLSSQFAQIASQREAFPTIHLLSN
jgi:ADP-ribose pyrophosphatase YjhB (NUDIX family)